MFAGKSTELLRRLRRLEISDKKCLLVKFAGDLRYGKDENITTHDNLRKGAKAVSQLSALGDMWREVDVIGIDEG